MQDWEWEVADADRVVEFLSVYERESLDVAERISLMEIIVQCAEDLADGPNGPAVWAEVQRLIWTHPEIHVATVRYWACLDGRGAAESFVVAPKMRELWTALSRRGADA